VRPDLLEPDTTEGIIPLGRYQYAFASLDFEVVSIRALALRPVDHPDHTKFEPDSDYCAFLVNVDVGLGKNCKKSGRSFWIKASEEVYRGDERRRGARMPATSESVKDFRANGSILLPGLAIISNGGTDGVCTAIARLGK